MNDKGTGFEPDRWMLDFSLIGHIDLLLFAAFTGAIVAALLAAVVRFRVSGRRPRDRFPSRNRR